MNWFIFIIYLLALPLSVTWAQTIVRPDSTSKHIERTISQKSPKIAFWRSVAFPGLGQHYIQKKTKAYLFAGVETTLLTAVIYEHNRTNHYSRLEDRAVSQNQAENYHAQYLKHFNRRQNILWINVAFWLYNTADAYVGAHLLSFTQPFELSAGFDIKSGSTLAAEIAYRF